MKKLSLGTRVALTVGSVYAFIIGAAMNLPVHISHPEPGVTCVQAETIFTRKRVNAGCYDGNVEQIGNSINHKATCKYQGLSC